MAPGLPQAAPGTVGLPHCQGTSCTCVCVGGGAEGPGWDARHCAVRPAAHRQPWPQPLPIRSSSSKPAWIALKLPPGSQPAATVHAHLCQGSQHLSLLQLGSPVVGEGPEGAVAAVVADLALLCHLPKWPSSRPAPNTPVRVNLSQKAPLVPTALVPWSPRGVGADKAVFTRPRAGGQRYKDPILLAPAASPSPSTADIRGWVSQRGVPTPGGLLSHWPGHQGLPWLGTRTQLPLWAWGRRA